MAFAITTTYSGEAAAGYISKALLQGSTLSGRNVTIMPKVKHSVAVQKLDTGTLLQSDGSTFNSSGTITIAESILTPIAMRVNTQAGINDLENFWEARQLADGANNNDLPGDFQSYIIDYFCAKIASENEVFIWQGDTAGSTGSVLDLANGYIKILSAASDSVKVTGTTLTSANILAQIKLVYEAIPAALLNKTDLKIYISLAAGRFYKEAIAAGTGNGGSYYIGDKELNFLGYELVPTPGMPDNKMVAGQISGLFYGCDSASDISEIKLIDMRETTGDDLIRFKARMKGGMQIGHTNEFVLYA